jgi:nitrite reductase/ring-hydroxylating ferredoxin subunit/uncharacterized membrane protein
MMMENLHAIIDWIDKQTWLDRMSKRMQKLVQNFFSSGGSTLLKIRDFLHGVWLGHPLHPVLTDIPIGSWVSALFLDILESTTGKKAFGRGADTAIKVGLVGAVGSAITGVVDWHHTEGRPRRVGSMHATLNTISAALYVFSLVMREKRQRETGRTLSVLGFLVSVAAAYLGGHLVYGLKIGVDRSPDSGLPEEFTPVIPFDDLPENTMHRVVVGTQPVLLVRRGIRVYALAETCSHMAGPLSEGKLFEHNGAPAVSCPWHGSKFSMKDGSLLSGPSTYIQPCFETRVMEGQIEIRANKDTID